ncbi:unnamed protein product [Adineta ricciae]|uniref:G-protein coupled receptors family 1 profile domain-containing protein n=1 Tax=Adineta ricciae TaxID=249248 RepID=A0A815ZC06_ADIRI|nr:unnamed protein product [Adineta ricciae]CAF1580587.1 unnamed protein product [Adineta ricciae]
MNEIDFTTFQDEKFVLHRVKFTILLTLQIPAILLSLLIFFYFFTHRTILHIRQNQALFLLLIINFIQLTFDLPMIIHFNRLGYVSPTKSSYCTWWTFLEYILNAASEMLMATISIQRHILIFHSNLFNNRLNRYIFHHLPLLICIIYPIILYLIIIVFDFSCDGTQWDYSSNVCGLANCYLVYDKVLGSFDWAFNNGLPVLVIIFANIGLIIRVLRQKRRGQGIISWKKQRKLTLQLLSISSIYFLGWFPNIFIGIIQQLFIPGFISNIQFDYIFDLLYLIYLLMPWICLGLFPEFIKWIRKFFVKEYQRGNTIRPTNHFN